MHEVTWQMTLCGQLFLKANGAEEHLSCIKVLTAYAEEYGLPQKQQVAYCIVLFARCDRCGQIDRF